MYIPDPQLTSAEAAAMATVLAREERAELALIPRADNTPLHPKARHLEKHLRAAQPDRDWGHVRCEVPDLPFVRVSPQGIDRAVALTDTMCQAFERRGWVWKVSPSNSQRAAYLLVEGEQFYVQIEEVVRRKRHVDTPEERARRKRYWDKVDLDNGDWVAAAGASSTPAWDHHPTGEFSIKHLGTTTLVKDTSSAAIESRFGRLPRRLIELAFAEKARTRIRAEYDAKLAVEADRRARIARAKELETAARDRLRDLAERWEQAGRLRAFLTAVADAPVAGEVAEQREEWLRWAHKHVAYVDPLQDPEALIRREASFLTELPQLTPDRAQG